MKMKKPNIISALLDIFAQTKKNTELLQNLQNQPKNEPVAPPTANRKVIRVSTNSAEPTENYEVTIPSEMVGKLAKISIVAVQKYSGSENEQFSEMTLTYLTLPEKISSSIIWGYDIFSVYDADFGKKDKLFIIDVLDGIEQVVV